MSSKNKTYNRLKLIFSFAGILFSILYLCIILLNGFSKQLADWTNEKSTNPYWALILYAAILGGIRWTFLFPLSWFSGHWLEHHYQLSHQTFLRWLGEGMKGWVVSMGISLPLILTFYYFLRNFPNGWWALLASVLTLFSVLLARLAPVLIFPWFYKFIPIANLDLKERLILLCRRVNMKVEGIFSFNLSKNTRKANAAFTGLGKSKRIIIADTLIENFTIDEIASVFTHELGHYKNGHLWKGIFVGTVFLFFSFWLTHQIYSALLIPMGFRRMDDLGALPLMILILIGIQFVIMSFSNAYSRANERTADRFALENGPRHPFISSMKKLAEQNMADETPHPLVEWMFYSHPSISKRIRYAETIPGGAESFDA